jgi:hypothetical protein
MSTTPEPTAGNEAAATTTTPTKAPVVAGPDNRLKNAMGQLWPVDALPNDIALLRRIAHNTNVIRLVLIWTLVVVPTIVLIMGIIGLVMLHGMAPTATPVDTNPFSPGF